MAGTIPTGTVLWLTALMCAASVTRNLAGFGAVAGAAVMAMAVFVLMLPLFLLDEDENEGMVHLSVGVEPGWTVTVRAISSALFQEDGTRLQGIVSCMVSRCPSRPARRSSTAP